jgi:hypothetical protein
MISTELLINIIVIGLITIVFGCMLGLAITRIIDKHLADISIKMPNIVIPRDNAPHSYLYEDQHSLYEPFEDAPPKKTLGSLKTDTNTNSMNQLKNPISKKPEPPTQITPKSQPTSQTQITPKPQPTSQTQITPKSQPTSQTQITPKSQPTSNLALKVKQAPQSPLIPKTLPIIKQLQELISPLSSKVQIMTSPDIKPHQISLPSVTAQPVTTIPNPRQLVQDVPNMNKLTQSSPNHNSRAIGCTADDDCNVVYGNGQNKCLSSGECYCAKGSGQFCHYGPTYYKDPKDMTDEQRRKFKLKAKVYKMTLQDYINWLRLFEDEQDLLSPRDLANLQKLLKGIHLKDEDVPRENIPPPLTAEQYFNQLYMLDAQLNPQNADTAGLQLPANYTEYSQYDNPRNLKHLDDHNQLEMLSKYQNREVLDKTQWKISHDYLN